MADQVAGEWKPHRSRDLEARIRAIENQLVLVSVAPQSESEEGGTVVVSPSGSSPTILPEESIDFDAGDGHNHDGEDSTPVDLTGDVTGTNTANVVEKARGVDFPNPVAGDDWKFLSYLHSSVDYVLRHPTFKNVTKTADYTATLDDFVIFVDATGGNVIITLPTALAATQRGFFIKRIDASTNVVTIDGNGVETIDGALNYLPISMESVTVVSTGTVWYIL